MPVFKSGAFLQQCFSVHPLALCLKLVQLPSTAGILCLNCRMRHRLTIEEASASPGPKDDEGHEENALSELGRCFQAHSEDIRLVAVGVEQSSVRFRCRRCHRNFGLSIRIFETHQS